MSETETQIKFGSGIELSLKGKIALVTGSSSGLGMEIARYLARAGAYVGIHYHSEKDQANMVADEINKNGGKAKVFGGDVSDLSQVQGIFMSLDKELGPIDILVNNAGVDGKRQICGDDDPKLWEKVIAINLFGPYYCAREAVKRMRTRGSGVIINITSVHEFLPWSGFTAYCSAKAGLSMFTKTLAQEVSESGIRVVSVAPGAIKTPINKDVWGNPETYKDLLTKISMPRMGETGDIAKAVAFLSSDMASYVTGTTLVVDGGMLLYPAFKHGG
ncbi:MAG: glucose 1-dehydrogenase [Candidatus Thermoplasmatota archaeon]|nr:glucose 1-dehydrogenase [Candidatus Thermoplasmatota archaeon]